MKNRFPANHLYEKCPGCGRNTHFDNLIYNDEGELRCVKCFDRDLAARVAESMRAKRAETVEA